MRNQRDTSLQIRLAGMAILGLFIALAAAAYFSGRQVKRSSELITADAVPGMIAAHDMRMAMSRSVGYMMVAASAQTPSSRDASIQIAHDADVAFTNAITRYKATVIIDPAQDEAMLAQVTTRFAEFKRQRMTYEALILAGNRDGSAAFLETNLVPAYVAAIQPAEDLLKYNNGNSVTYANYIRNSVHRLYWALAVVTMLALVCVVVLVVNFAIRRHEMEQLKMLKVSVEKHFDAGYWMNAKNQIIHVNDTACKVLGYTRKELLGNPLTMIAPSATPQILEQIWKNLRETGFFTRESMHRRKDGSQFPVEVVATYVRFGGKEFNCGFARDITERKRLEQKQAELAAIVASSDDAIIGKSLTGIITSWNRGAEKIFGYSAAEAIGQPLLMLIPADRQHEESSILEKIRRGEAVEHFETVRIRKDGRQIYISATISPLKDGQGKVIGASKIARDVTTSKQVAEKLRETESSQRTLIDAVQEAFCLMKPDGTLTVVNQAFARRFGKTVEELVGVNGHELSPPDVAARRREFYKQLLQLGQPITFEDHREGIDLENRIYPARNAAGEITHFATFSSDITKQKRVEEEIRATNKRYSCQQTGLMELTRAYALRRTSIADLKREVAQIAAETLDVERVSIWLYERDHQSIVCQELFERSKQSHSAGMALRAEDIPGYFRALREGDLIVAHDAYSDPRTTELSEIYLRPLGISSMLDAPIHVIGSVTGVVCCESVGVARRWTADEQTFIIAIANVVSLLLAEEGRQQIEEQFRQSQKMEAIGQLASGVAHDFNNILAVIQMQAYLLEVEADLSPVQRGLATDIGEATQRAAALTRQLLLFSRKERMQTRELDLDKSITDMTKMLRRTLGDDIELRFKFSLQPLLVCADPGMMDQVLMNLAVNARDAMSKGGNLVIETSAVELDALSVATTPQSRPGAFVCLSVSDTGCGISPEVMPNIFDPFFTTKEVGKGTGLGLATVFGIVQQHQGWINVYSEVGHGTTFRIYLPRLAKISDQKPVLPAPTPAPALDGNETILIVEDEPKLRASVVKVLSDLGYNVLEAHNGANALEVWQQHGGKIHLLLTDMVIPGGMSGKDLGEQLLKEKPGLKVIYVSGYSPEVAGKDFPLQEGVNFLIKPFQVQRIVQTIRNQLDQIDD